MTAGPGIEYVIPLRWDGGSDSATLQEFARYLGSIVGVADITVVDGSPPCVVRRHAECWGRYARILRPAPWPGGNGKVAGVVSGVRAARHECVVIADDDVRYLRDDLTEVAARLVGYDMVWPQNVFIPGDAGRLPWHARWDTGRILLNRAGGGDYPGTVVIRRSTFLSVGGYDGDVLFENLQLLRTFRAIGARVRQAPDLCVGRRAPGLSRFAEQRVRQAYDDLSQPARCVFEACWLPLGVVSAVRRPRWLLAAAAVAIGVAEYGRRRHAGGDFFPRSSAVWAPLWMAERAVTVWLAIGCRLRGGVRYRGRRMRHATRPVRPGPALPDSAEDLRSMLVDPTGQATSVPASRAPDRRPDRDKA